MAIDDLQAMRRVPTEGESITTVILNLYILSKGLLIKVSDQDNGGTAWRRAWPSTDLPPVGWGLVGQVTVLASMF